MNPDHCTVLIDADTIAARIEIANEITAKHSGEKITAVCILKGNFVFMADLVRAMGDHHVEVEFLGVSSYEGTATTGAVKITHDLLASIENKRVLLVEDIVDTGLTLSTSAHAATRRPASLEIVTLLDKPARRRVPMKPDYCGFEIDHFVVGCSLDLDQAYRPALRGHPPPARGCL